VNTQKKKTRNFESRWGTFRSNSRRKKGGFRPLLLFEKTYSPAGGTGAPTAQPGGGG